MRFGIMNPRLNNPKIDANATIDGINDKFNISNNSNRVKYIR